MTASQPSLTFICASIALALASACREEALTQLVVVVDSDWDGFERVEIALDRFADDVVIDVEPRRDRPLLPRRLALVHDGGELGPIGVTVRGFVAGREEPVLVEPRSGLFFERGTTRMLKIDLLFECIGRCPEEACIAGPTCVPSDDGRVTKLVGWDGDVDAIDVTHRGAMLDAGSEGGSPMPGMEAGVDGGSVRSDGGGSKPSDGGDGAIEQPDADATIPEGTFPYVPSHFDPLSAGIMNAARESVVLDCGVTRFDSTSLAFTNFCGAGEPAAVLAPQSGGSDAVVLVMDGLTIASGATLELTGNRPVILAVFGDARIDGTLDASARGPTPGPGAGLDCASGQGDDGGQSEWQSGVGAGGGGGGAFGSSGGDGGEGGLASQGDGSPDPAATGGTALGSAGLASLRGGCAGGDGGEGTDDGGPGGAGGGALQVSAARVLEVNGTITAAGGGGTAGMSALSGGGGGGSGGAIALEAATLEFGGAAKLNANGGGGGAGQAADPEDAAASAGADGASGIGAAAGGDPESTGGRGGNGAAAGVSAQAGDVGGASSSYGHGGGGGGGGVGRVTVRGADGCVLPGASSPAPTVECVACGACPKPQGAPSSDCAPYEHDARTYYRCSAPLDWDDAAANCRSVGLQLVRIDDQAENDAVATDTTEDTWIGASDVAVEGDWRWSDGTAFWSGAVNGVAVSGRYEAWADAQSEQPDNMTPSGAINADCAIMDSDGGWADRSCSTAHPYICEP